MSAEPFFTQRDAAVEFTRLAACCEAVFVAAGEAVGGAGEPRVRADPAGTDARTKVALAGISRRFGLHAAAWAELVPEAVLLADARAAVSPAPAVARTPRGVAEALAMLRDDLHALAARLSPVADGAARRLASVVLADLEEGLTALGKFRPG